MYYRITSYGFDAARRDEFIEFADTLRDELNEISGLELIHTCETGEGEGMIVARYDSEASAAAAQPHIQSILGRMATFLTSSPEIQAGDVIWEM